MTYLAHKIKLKDITKEQNQYFLKACGVARFAYNWALNQWNQKGNKISKFNNFEARKHLNSIKRKQYPWMMEVTKCAVQCAILDLDKAFKNHYKNPKHFHYPNFRRKFVHTSFTLSNEQFEVNTDKIWIPKLGWVKMCECLRFGKDIKLISATVSHQADGWYVSICVDAKVESLTIPPKNTKVGIDLGIDTLATLSNGEKHNGYKPLKRLLGKIKKLQRSLSRKQKGSNNWHKAKTKLAKLHLRIRNIRQDCLHKLTTYIANNFHTVVIEDLNVKGMMKNHKLARAISDMGFYEFKRQLTYKIALRGGKLFVANRWFASSKTCHCCGYKVESMPLSIRNWQCPDCQTVHDRDVNAAKNLVSLLTGSSSALTLVDSQQCLSSK